MPNQKKLAWTPWIENGSRNLSRVLNDPVKMMADLHVGPDDIVRSFKALPKTHHDITGPAEKFSLDAFPVPHGTSTGLLVIVHGQFTEGKFFFPSSFAQYSRSYSIFSRYWGYPFF